MFCANFPHAYEIIHSYLFLLFYDFRCKTEATVVPGVMSGANVQEDVMMNTPITIQVVYTDQLEANNQDVTIK